MRFFKPKGIIRGAYRNFANVTGWFGWSRVRDSSVDLVKMIKPIYKKKEATRDESFKQAMIRLNLTDADIQERANVLKKQIILYVGLSIPVLGYMLYLWVGVHLVAGFLALTVSGLFLIKAFHCYFWLYQIKQRRLGCTWRQALFNKPGEKQ